MSNVTNNSEKPTVPAFFKDEKTAINCVAQFLDFTNESVKNEGMLERSNFINNMLQNNISGGRDAVDTPEYAEAYDYISTISSRAFGQGEIKFPLPSHPDTKIHAVYNPSLNRPVLQINMGEMAKQDWDVPPKVAPSNFFHSNKHYVSITNQERSDLVLHQREAVQRLKEQQDPSLLSKKSKIASRTARCLSQLFLGNKASVGLTGKMSFAMATKPKLK